MRNCRPGHGPDHDQAAVELSTIEPSFRPRAASCAGAASSYPGSPESSIDPLRLHPRFEAHISEFMKKPKSVPRLAATINPNTTYIF